MHVIHVALGGCLTYPDVRYGLTEDTGGHIAYILGAARAQARREDIAQVDIVTRAFDDPALGRDHAILTQRVSSKLRILRLPTDRSDYLAKEALAAEWPSLRRAFRALIGGMDRRPDVIHAHFADAMRLVMPVARRLQIPVVYTPHSLGIDKARLLNAGPALAARIVQEREALRRADAVIVSSWDEAERQVESYGIDVARRCHRIVPGIALPASSPATAEARDLVDPLLAEPERPMVLAIARPVARKNLAGLMRAWLRHRDLAARTNLVILAGQGDGRAGYTEARAVLRELGDLAQAAPGRIALPAHHASRTVPQMYRLAAQRRGVFVNPALHEPFGLTLLEAAQAGLPVVATREGGPADIVGTLGHGLLVDPRDDAAIAEAICRLIHDRDAWATAAQAGRDGALAFDWDRWAAQAGRIYRGLRPAVRPSGPPTRLLARDDA